MSLSSSGRTSQEGKLTSYFELISPLLATYVANNGTPEDDMDFMNFKQTAGQSADEYVQALCPEALHCRSIYNKYYLEGTFNEGLKQPIRQSVPSY